MSEGNGAKKFRVLVTDKIAPAGLKALVEHPKVELVMAVKPAPEQLEAELPKTDVWLVRSATKITEALIGKAAHLRLIGRAGVGVDNIDVKGASRRGIAVINAPAANTVSACEHTLGLLLALSRNIPQADRDVREGGWQRAKWMGVELSGKTLGLVGLGRIGRAVAKRAKSFGMTIAAHDPFISKEQAEVLGVRLMTFREVLEGADFVSLHVPGSEKTRHLINKESLSWFKNGARLINCARGELVVEADLAAAVRSGRLAGAAIDVFESEPLDAGSALRGVARIILTPHLGASTAEAQLKVAEDLSTGVLEFLEKGMARNAINLPGFDPDTLEALGPILGLADSLGRFLGQMLDAGLKGVHSRFHGEFDAAHKHPLSVAALKGILSTILERNLSFINAPVLALDRGIETSISTEPAAKGAERLLTVTAVTDDGKRSVSGTVGENGEPRIVRLDRLFVDVCPKGRMLVVTNHDRPGIIGSVGSLLGKHTVNIADMRVGRRSAHGEAVMVITVDDELTSDLLGELEKIDGIKSVRSVVL